MDKNKICIRKDSCLYFRPVCDNYVAKKYVRSKFTSTFPQTITPTYKDDHSPPPMYSTPSTALLKMFPNQQPT